MIQRVVIIGSGQAGLQAAISLREKKFEGSVVLIGEEPGLPYQRPPLSKAFLLGKTQAPALVFRPREFLARERIELVEADPAVALDRQAKSVTLQSGTVVAYDHLVLAVGARNRPLALPGIDLDGVLSLRTLLDATAIRARLSGRREVVVIGAGFIGLEVAASAAVLGHAVRVLEVAERPLARAVSPELSSFLLRAHRARSVAIDCAVTARQIVGQGGRLAAVELASGERLPADLVVVGIGVVPNVELARDAGLAVANGIVVDQNLVTSDPSISAIGDCAFFPCRYAGGMARLESVQNAIDQGRAVAARLTGTALAYDDVPWFWSDQFELKLQIAGISTGHTAAILRGNPSEDRFSVFCFKDERLLGVESINAAADHMIGRRLIANDIPLSPAEAADPGFDLRSRAGLKARAS